jgi:hypothetical protein
VIRTSAITGALATASAGSIIAVTGTKVVATVASRTVSADDSLETGEQFDFVKRQAAAFTLLTALFKSHSAEKASIA